MKNPSLPQIARDRDLLLWRNIFMPMTASCAFLQYQKKQLLRTRFRRLNENTPPLTHNSGKYT